MLQLLTVTLSFIFFANLVQAKQFSTEFIEFELPPGWSCVLEGSEYVCQSENKDRRKEAIIILAAKKRGEKDSLESYQGHLNRKKTYTIPGGKSQVSEPKYTKVKKINNHQWIDSLHLASEIPGFYTRYLATVKEDIGVAVTFSVAKEFYKDYNQSVFDRIISSLRVFRQANLDKRPSRILKNEDVPIDDITFIPDEDTVDISISRKNKGKAGEGGGDNTLFLVIGAVVVAFVLMKLKR
jgi:hypothetical protein